MAHTPEQIERMEQALRKLATVSSFDYVSSLEPVFDEVCAIVATLPKPVDPDLLTARGLAVDGKGLDPFHKWNADVMSGRLDDGSEVQIALLALRRGRELEREAMRGGLNSKPAWTPNHWLARLDPDMAGKPVAQPNYTNLGMSGPEDAEGRN